MHEMNFDWDDLRLFLAVARLGGLANAAEATGKSPPTLGRRMLALERRLSKELFHRLPRGYTLTRDGEQLLIWASGLEEQILSVTESNKASAQKLVKVSAGTWVTRYLCERLPVSIADQDVRVRFISADHFLDMRRREAVVGVRNRRPEETGLAGRLVSEVNFAVYAVSESIRTWAKVDANTPSAKWMLNAARNAPVIEVTHPRNALDLALAGHAKAVLPCFVGDAEAGLTRIGDEIPELRHDQWLVTHQDDRFLPEVRSVIDEIGKLLHSSRND